MKMKNERKISYNELTVRKKSMKYNNHALRKTGTLINSTQNETFFNTSYLFKYLQTVE